MHELDDSGGRQVVLFLPGQDPLGQALLIGGHVVRREKERVLRRIVGRRLHEQSGDTRG